MKPNGYITNDSKGKGKGEGEGDAKYFLSQFTSIIIILRAFFASHSCSESELNVFSKNINDFQHRTHIFHGINSSDFIGCGRWGRKNLTNVSGQVDTRHVDMRKVYAIIQSVPCRPSGLVIDISIIICFPLFDACQQNKNQHHPIPTTRMKKQIWFYLWRRRLDFWRISIQKVRLIEWNNWCCIRSSDTNWISSFSFVLSWHRPLNVVIETFYHHLFRVLHDTFLYDCRYKALLRLDVSVELSQKPPDEWILFNYTEVKLCHDGDTRLIGLSACHFKQRHNENIEWLKSV